MSSCTTEDFTDDESEQDQNSVAEESIEGSIPESSSSGLEDSYQKRGNSKKSSTGAIKRNSSPSISPKDINKTDDKINESGTDYHRASFMKGRSPVISSDSDSELENIGVKIKSKKNVIVSDSESETENLKVLDKSNKLEVSDSIEAIESDPEIESVTKSLNKSRISNEFNFGKIGNIINSTLLDIDNQNTPPRVGSSKRLFNKSADTPRILKQLKESSTPKNVLTPKIIQEKGIFEPAHTPKILNNFKVSLTPKNVPSPSITLLQENDPMRTPRNVKAIIPSRSPSPSSSVEVLSDNDDIIDVSSDDVPSSPVPWSQPKKKVVKQTTLDSMVVRPVFNTPKIVNEQNKLPDKSDVIEVCPKELYEQKMKVTQMERDLSKANNLLRTVNLESLPDKGKLIKDRHATIERTLKQETENLSRMVACKKDPPDTLKVEAARQIPATWEKLEAGAGAVMPRTFGKQAMSTYNAQKAVTLDRLQQLYVSLESCPKEDTVEKDPKGLKVELMPHQKRALAWLMWRENQKPSGGILADDMGLGKTLTLISLMLKMMETENEDSDSENWLDKESRKVKGRTLVVCPASLLNQWSGELERRTKRGLASFEIYHGPKRESNAKKLSKYDMVITTYAIIMNECEKNGTVFRVKWRRIIIDEAHQIRNHKSLTSDAVCRLSAKSRWALTGTPVHNKELDMYALLKFLRCTPFDDIQVWKRWVSDKSTGGQERLHTVISSLMLRRTKAELMAKGALQCMPDRKWELIPVELNKSEMDVYQKILLFSRTLFAQFLHQRAEKRQDELDLRYTNLPNQENAPNQEYYKMREKLLRFHKVRDIKQHEILVLLLRLRQICCHPSLITSMLQEDMESLDDDDNPNDMNILDQLNKMALDDDEYNSNVSNVADGLASQEEAPGLSEAAKCLLNPSNPVFSSERMSSKIKVALDVLKEKVVRTEDKAIIVSQWPSFLRLIAYHLKSKHIPFDQLDGNVPVSKRMVMVDRFNNPKDKMKILLLSLTAGGVGLNLVGANHLFLLDLHWNPQLENQAQDRIYRVGQEKPVFVYKFMATDTIEKRILDLQQKKLDIANSMLTGTKQVIDSKLSLQDLKLLFEM